MAIFSAPFSMAQACEFLGVTELQIEAMIARGVVLPSRGRRFTYQDLVLLKAAQQLTEAGIPEHRQTSALVAVQNSLSL
ncbi:MerR family transcriptional regulator [Roseateles sp. So40a]|uniref:MerR family transcriptional regulator n=1 Tax=Roseateles sp. So40a TaxID=3400226 RepID=UPI003A87F89A